MAKKRKGVTTSGIEPEFESSFQKDAEFDNADIVKELKEELRDLYPDLKVKVKLHKKRSEPDLIVFRFDDSLPSSEVLKELKTMSRAYQQMHYRDTKCYSQWEVNFRISFKVKELEEESEETEDLDV